MFMESQKPMPFGTTFELRTAYDKTLLDNPSLTIAVFFPAVFAHLSFFLAGWQAEG